MIKDPCLVLQIVSLHKKLKSCSLLFLSSKCISSANSLSLPTTQHCKGGESVCCASGAQNNSPKFHFITLTSGINDLWGINVPPGHVGWKKLATCIESATPMTKTCNFYIVEYVVRLMDPLGNFPQNQLATRCQ